MDGNILKATSLFFNNLHEVGGLARHRYKKKKMFQAEAVEAEKSFLLVPKSIEKNKIK